MGVVVRVAAHTPVQFSFFSVTPSLFFGTQTMFMLALAIAMAVAAATDSGAADKRSLQIIVPDVVLADPGETIELPIRLEPVEAIPRNSLIRIRGLPQRVSLNAGYLVSAGTWAVPLSAVSSLNVTVPDDLTARSEISFVLADVDGRVYAEKRSRIIVARTGGASTAVVAQAATIPIPPLAMPVLPGEPAVRPTMALAAIGKSTVESVYALPALPPEAQLNIPASVRLELEQILAEGDQSLISGDVEFARRIYRLVTERGLGLAAMKMAETFDPRERKRLVIRDTAESAALARAWYRRAADLGEKRALERLKRLDVP